MRKLSGLGSDTKRGLDMFFNWLKRRLSMTTLADDIIATKAAVDALTVKVDALAATGIPATVDLTPVLAAIAEIEAKLTPTA